MNRKTPTFSTKLLSLLAVVSLIFVFQVACGTGGGSGGLSGGGPAGINVRIEPNVLDTGDRSTVTLNIGDFRDTNIAIKFRSALGLTYVTNTAFFIIDGELVDTFPTTVVSDSSAFNYLVFYISRTTFGDRGEGVLTFELEASADIENGLVEVDIDLDDPAVNNSTEFQVTTPEFNAQDTAFVRVGPEPTSSSSSSSGA